tara:strand:+ start:346 stop:669 length:324 start_codon:yes stop_codon:yes gene_type:complete
VEEVVVKPVPEDPVVEELEVIELLVMDLAHLEDRPYQIYLQELIQLQSVVVDQLVNTLCKQEVVEIQLFQQLHPLEVEVVVQNNLLLELVWLVVLVEVVVEPLFQVM